jgi:hypothetical protein
VAKNGGSDGTDSLTLIQAVNGGQGTNVFNSSTAQAYTMHGGYGSNTFNEQNDAYSDQIVGGSGSNTLNYSGFTTAVTANFTGASGTISKAAGGIDSVSNVPVINTGSGNDSFTLDSNSLSYFTSINAGAGANSLKVNDTLSAVTGVGSKLASIFQDIQTINLSSMTKSGDSFGTITGDQVFSILQANSTLALSLKTGSSLATSLAIGDGSTYTSHVTTGNSTTWYDASHTHSVTLQVSLV